MKEQRFRGGMKRAYVEAWKPEDLQPLQSQYHYSIAQLYH